ncbi:MAG: hypothetical protein AB9M53_00920 [Leptothrix sp. (in: b-proteobacteria)]
MKLTQKLIGYLNRVFAKGPETALAFRLNYAGISMLWTVSDGVLTTSVVGGVGSNLTVPLGGFTIAQLAQFLASQPGYSVPFVADADLAARSALALMDGTGNPAQSNGDHLEMFTSVMWSYMNGQANELTLARQAIGEALLQMAANTAALDWVDEHGGYYGVRRKDGEVDLAYAGRIIAEVGRARGNGVAISEAVKVAIGAGIVSVVDVGTVTVASSNGRGSYGLFDVEVEVSNASALSQTQIEGSFDQIIEAMRDAGTHLRALRFIKSTKLQTYAGAALRVGENVLMQYGVHGVTGGGASPFVNGPSANQEYRVLFEQSLQNYSVGGPPVTDATSLIGGTLTYASGICGSGSLSYGAISLQIPASGDFYIRFKTLIQGPAPAPTSLDAASTNILIGDSLGGSWVIQTQIGGVGQNSSGAGYASQYQFGIQSDPIISGPLFIDTVYQIEISFIGLVVNLFVNGLLIQSKITPSRVGIIYLFCAPQANITNPPQALIDDLELVIGSGNSITYTPSLTCLTGGTPIAVPRGS